MINKYMSPLTIITNEMSKRTCTTQGAKPNTKVLSMQ